MTKIIGILFATFLSVFSQLAMAGSWQSITSPISSTDVTGTGCGLILDGKGALYGVRFNGPTCTPGYSGTPATWLYWSPWNDSYPAHYSLWTISSNDAQLKVTNAGDGVHDDYCSDGINHGAYRYCNIQWANYASATSGAHSITFVIDIRESSTGLTVATATRTVILTKP